MFSIDNFRKNIHRESSVFLLGVKEVSIFTPVPQSRVTFRQRERRGERSMLRHGIMEYAICSMHVKHVLGLKKTKI